MKKIGKVLKIVLLQSVICAHSCFGMLGVQPSISERKQEYWHHIDRLAKSIERKVGMSRRERCEKLKKMERVIADHEGVLGPSQSALAFSYCRTIEEEENKANELLSRATLLGTNDPYMDAQIVWEVQPALTFFSQRRLVIKEIKDTLKSMPRELILTLNTTNICSWEQGLAPLGLKVNNNKLYALKRHVRNLRCIYEEWQEQKQDSPSAVLPASPPSSFP